MSSGAVVTDTPSTTNSTLPVRVGPPASSGWTVAVKVTAWPKTDGSGAEVTVVIELAMVWLPFG